MCNGTECVSKKVLMNSWSILYTVPATSDKNPQYGKKLHTWRQVCQINKNPWILRIRGFLFIWQTCLQVFSYFFHISDFVFCHRTVSIKKLLKLHFLKIFPRFDLTANAWESIQIWMTIISWATSWFGNSLVEDAYGGRELHHNLIFEFDGIIQRP